MNQQSAVNNQSWQQNYELIPAHELLAPSDKVEDLKDKSGQCVAFTSQQNGQHNNILTQVPPPVTVKVEGGVQLNTEKNIDPCLAIKKEHNGHNDSAIQMAPSSIAQQAAVNEVAPYPTPTSIQHQQGGIRTSENTYFLAPICNNVILPQVPICNNVIYLYQLPIWNNVIIPQLPPPSNSAAPCSKPKCTDNAAGDDATTVVKTENKDSSTAISEPRQTGRKSSYDETQDDGSNCWKSQSQPEFEYDSDNDASITGTDNTDHASQDEGITGQTEDEDDDDEDDDLEMEDDSDDEDYVPDFKVIVPKRKKKQRANTLRSRLACSRALTVKDEPTEPPQDDGDGDKKPSSGSSGEADHMEHERESTEYPCSSEDSDEIERKEKLRVAKQQDRLKWKLPRSIRQEVRFARFPRVYECKICHERFTEADEMRVHYTELHSKEPNKMADGDQPQLNGVPSSSADGDIMAEIATELRQCKKCKEYVNSMKKHYERVHRKRTRFVCEVCGKVYDHKNSFTDHQSRHKSEENENLFKCTKCEKSYSTRQCLYRHFSTIHSGNNDMVICEQCGKQFSKGNSFKVHRLIHLKEKPFKCSECGRGFSQKSNMTLHMRTHTGVRPYKCDVCEESFNHNVSLKTHQKKAHGIDWWKDKDRAAVS